MHSFFVKNNVNIEQKIKLLTPISQKGWKYHKILKFCAYRRYFLCRRFIRMVVNYCGNKVQYLPTLF